MRFLVFGVRRWSGVTVPAPRPRHSTGSRTRERRSTPQPPRGLARRRSSIFPDGVGKRRSAKATSAAPGARTGPSRRRSRVSAGNGAQLRRRGTPRRPRRRAAGIARAIASGGKPSRCREQPVDLGLRLHLARRLDHLLPELQVVVPVGADHVASARTASSRAGRRRPRAPCRSGTRPRPPGSRGRGRRAARWASPGSAGSGCPARPRPSAAAGRWSRACRGPRRAVEIDTRTTPSGVSGG